MKFVFQAKQTAHGREQKTQLLSGFERPELRIVSGVLLA
jgi:hypothetical protein